MLLCGRGFHEGYASEIVRGEILQSEEPHATRDLGLILRLGLSHPAYGEARYLDLFGKYDSDPTVSQIPEADLRHMAIYSASDLEALVTYDLKHLGDQVRLDVVRKINHAQGITNELRIGPPEPFLPPAPTE